MKRLSMATALLLVCCALGCRLERGGGGFFTNAAGAFTFNIAGFGSVPEPATFGLPQDSGGRPSGCFGAVRHVSSRCCNEPFALL